MTRLRNFGQLSRSVNLSLWKLSLSKLSLLKPSLIKTACILLVLCFAAAIAAQAQTFTSQFSFDGSNGNSPQWAALVQGRDGNFYGTTSGGGVYQSGCYRSTDGDCGTAFKITPAGTLTTLHRFQNGADGSGAVCGKSS